MGPVNPQKYTVKVILFWKCFRVGITKLSTTATEKNLTYLQEESK